MQPESDQPLDGLTESVRRHIYALYYDELKLCSCGLPEESFDLVRNILSVLGADAEEERRRELQALIPVVGARQMVLAMLGAASLAEHGTVIGGS
jgi:hypothetical protein